MQETKKESIVKYATVITRTAVVAAGIAAISFATAASARRPRRTFRDSAPANH